MPLTKVSFSVIQVANNVTSTTVGNTTSIPSFTFDQNGVITSASNTAISGAGITANTVANSAFQTGSVENYLRGANLDFGMRNRIINGAMVIDQRNAGASVTPTSNGTYTLDRWQMGLSNASKYSVQQSSTAPTGFSNSLLVTSLAATTVASNDFYSLLQAIEGFNTADLGFGTANAKTVTVSFWVRSSLTGTFGGFLQNSANNRSYPFSYTISVADTWEQKTITIVGDTSGTWIGATNGVGLYVGFSLGMGTDRKTTANSWQTGNYRSVTGETAVVGTNGATFYITGVQLEVGSTATSFDYRPYGTEFMLCQRYLPAYRATGSGNQDVGNGLCNSTTAAYFAFDFVVQPRIEPTGATISSGGHFGAVNAAFSATNLFTGLTFSVGSLKRALLSGTGSSGLVQGNATIVRSQSSSAYILFTGCEL